MRKSKDSRWAVGLAATVSAIASLGIAGSFYVVRNDPKGWTGIWQKKKRLIQISRPELAPTMDQAERTVRSLGRLGAEPKPD